MGIEKKLLGGAHVGHPLNEWFWCPKDYMKAS